MPVPIAEVRKHKGLRGYKELEAHFQERVIQLAKLYGWGWPNPEDPEKYEGIYHNPDSRKDNAGLWDLTLIHSTRHQVLCIELKRRGERLNKSQERVWARINTVYKRLWVHSMERIIAFYIWTPDDEDCGLIDAVLKGEACQVPLEVKPDPALISYDRRP